MGIYSGGTFRVGPTPSFSYSNRDIQYYEHAIDMWEDKHIWDNIRNKYRTLHGSQKGAQIIQEGLQRLNLYQPGTGKDWKPSDMTEEEADLIEQVIKPVLKRKKLPLLKYSESLSKQARGKAFEQHFARLGEQLGINSITTGAKLVSSPVVIKTQIDLTGSGLGVGKYTQLQKKGTLQRQNYEDLISIVTKQLGEEFVKNLGGGLQVEIQKIIQATNNTRLGQIVIRQSDAPGKVDEKLLKATGSFTSQFHSVIDDMIQELQNHTFSLKNYKEATLLDWGGVSLGNANKFRFYGSFYQGATKSKKQLNFADLSTFIYASENSKNQEVHRYLSWARYIYELTGLGQGDIVDYLIINDATNGLVKVFSVKDLLKDAPNGTPGASMRNVLATGWIAEDGSNLHSTSKFIFRT